MWIKRSTGSFIKRCLTLKLLGFWDFFDTIRQLLWTKPILVLWMPFHALHIYQDYCFLIAGDCHESMAEPSDEICTEQIVLNDDCLLYIFNLLNFNDKTSCRLVSRQFRRLVDSMTLTKLVSLSFNFTAESWKFAGEFPRICYEHCFRLCDRTS